MSDIYDDFHINASKVGVNDTFSTHKVLGTGADEKASFYFAPFTATLKVSTGLINDTTTLSRYMRLSVDIPQDGLYEVLWSYRWSLNTLGNDFVSRLDHYSQGIDIGNGRHIQEPKDSAGTGIVLPLVGGGTMNSGTNQRQGFTDHDVLSLNSGNNDFDLDLACSSAGTRAAIYSARITVKRVG